MGHGHGTGANGHDDEYLCQREVNPRAGIRGAIIAEVVIMARWKRPWLSLTGPQ